MGGTLSRKTVGGKANLAHTRTHTLMRTCTHTHAHVHTSGEYQGASRQNNSTNEVSCGQGSALRCDAHLLKMNDAALLTRT
jgi:hypothetical protein